MNTLQITNASVIIFCILINITILFFVLINKVRSDKRSRVFIGVLSVNFILLMSFLIRQYYEGQPNPVYNSLLIYTASIYQATSQVLLLLHIKLTLLSIERKTAISGITKYAAYIAAAAVCINLILSVATPFTHVYFYFDEMNKTVLQDALIISDITTFIWAVLTLFILISNKKNLTIKEIGALMSYVVLPTIALIFYLITLNLHFIIFAIMLSIIIYYASIQSELSQQIKQQELDLKQKELELSYKDLELVKNRIATMTSQIQPHFIYNTLSAIKSLIRVDPKIAIETVSDFSKYLRGNIDSLSITKPVSFKDELKHVETYLSIEQKRFRNKLNITYNISVWDFDLPALSVQPIVENAVRHGITSSKENGGNITISVHEINDEIILTITDDGVGFDTTKASNKQEKVNVGLKNVRTRLAAMVGGKLDVQSEVNIGTTVTIIIPMGGAIPAGGTIPAGRTIPMRGAISRKE